jgi:integrase
VAKVFRRTHYGRGKGLDTRAWWIRYRDASGRDRRERIGPSKRQAEEVLALRLAAVVEGKKLPPRRDGAKLFSDFAREYMEVHGQRLRWAYNVAFIIRHWEKHLGPGCRLRDVNVRTIEAFRVKRLAEGVKTSTVNRNIAVLKRMLNVAIDWDLIQENPARRVKLAREDNARMRFLNQNEAARLLDACRRSRNRALAPLVLVALNTGARRGELLGLRWADVNFEARTLSFPRTKNGERRDVPVNHPTLQALRERRLVAGRGEFVFAERGRVTSDFRDSWATALRDAGIQDFRFHDLRHTYASWAAQAGMDIRRLQRLLGHKTLAMTQRYSHLGPKDLREAVDLVAFDGAAGEHAVR